MLCNRWLQPCISGPCACEYQACTGSTCLAVCFSLYVPVPEFSAARRRPIRSSLVPLTSSSSCCACLISCACETAHSLKKYADFVSYDQGAVKNAADLMLTFAAVTGKAKIFCCDHLPCYAFEGLSWSQVPEADHCVPLRGRHGSKQVF